MQLPFNSKGMVVDTQNIVPTLRTVYPFYSGKGKGIKRAYTTAGKADEGIMTSFLRVLVQRWKAA
jgi:hypothetical protein